MIWKPTQWRHSVGEEIADGETMVRAADVLACLLMLDALPWRLSFFVIILNTTTVFLPLRYPESPLERTLRGAGVRKKVKWVVGGFQVPPVKLMILLNTCRIGPILKQNIYDCPFTVPRKWEWVHGQGVDVMHTCINKKSRISRCYQDPYRLSWHARKPLTMLLCCTTADILVHPFDSSNMGWIHYTPHSIILPHPRTNSAISLGALFANTSTTHHSFFFFRKVKDIKLKPGDFTNGNVVYALYYSPKITSNGTLVPLVASSFRQRFNSTVTKAA